MEYRIDHTFKPLSPEQYDTLYKRGASDHAHFNATRAKLALGLPVIPRVYAEGLEGQEFMAWFDGWCATEDVLAEPEVKKAEARFLAAVAKWQKNWCRREVK